MLLLLLLLLLRQAETTKSFVHTIRVAGGEAGRSAQHLSTLVVQLLHRLLLLLLLRWMHEVIHIPREIAGSYLMGKRSREETVWIAVHQMILR